MVARGKECIVLNDAPLLGAVLDIFDALQQLKRGAMAAESVDFYGEYKLVLREANGLLECTNEFGGGTCKVAAIDFRAAAKNWCHAVLSELEEHHPGLSTNPNYKRHKTYVLEVDLG